MATLFPQIPEDIPSQTATEIGRTPTFDAEANVFLLQDGALVERTGQEAVKRWFELALRQQPDKVPIYPAIGERRYGVDRELIGRKLPDGFIVAELERNVRETASFCPAVRDIQNFSVARRGRACVISFTAVLHTAETVEVTANV